MASRPRKGRSGTVVIAAGGTGGHLFPAQALAEELARRGYAVHLMTDHRVRDYGAKFPAEQIYDIPSATLGLGQPWKLPLGSVKLVRGYNIARTILLYVKPVAIVGFGGYPSFPPVLAGVRLRVPTVIHEQNAVLGRANRAMSRFATAIASSFPTTANLNPALTPKVVMTGNPVRSAGAGGGGRRLTRSRPPTGRSDCSSSAAAREPNSSPTSCPIPWRRCRPRCAGGSRSPCNAARTMSSGYARPLIASPSSHEVKAFFSDLPKRIAEAQLVLCRSGASTIAELGTIGRPAILVPLPHAIDNDQLRNAQMFTGNGAGWLLQQQEIVPADLAAIITRLRYQDADLAAAAVAALLAGVPDAAERLADLVAGLARPMVDD